MNQPQYPQQPYAPQQPPQQGMSAGKIVLIVLGTIGLLVFGTCALCTVAVGGAAAEAEEQRAAEDSQKKAQAATCQNNDVEPWAGLKIMLEENEAKTVSMWTGTCAKVSGVVASVDSDFQDHPVVRIGAGEKYDFGGLRCEPADHQKALNLSKGQEITVWGIGGGEALGSLTLEQCDW
jgi:hypothetical protein